jgi:hypothetical protein
MCPKAQPAMLAGPRAKAGSLIDYSRETIHITSEIDEKGTKVDPLRLSLQHMLPLLPNRPPVQLPSAAAPM